MAASSTQTCRLFLAGTCTRGSSCRFSHQLPFTPSTPSAYHPIYAPHAPTLTAPKKKNKTCFDWQQGKCARGDGCLYLHKEVQAKTTKKQQMCNDWKAGHCIRGDSCRYLHTETVCRDWKATGACPRGEACHFLHPRGEGGRRKPCRDWAASRSCPRGSHCKYLHDATPSIQVVPGEQHRVRDPVDVLFLLDISSSMTGSKLDAAKAGILKIQKQLGANDRLGLITFNHEVRTVQPLEKIRAIEQQLQVRLAAVTASGSTRFRDAIIEGVETFKRVATAAGSSTAAPSKRHLELIVLTDGEDCGSTATLPHLETIVREPGIPDFHLVLIGVGMRPATREQLKNLCQPRHCKYVDVEESGEAIRIAIKTIVQKRLVVVSGAQVCKEFLRNQTCRLGSACPREHIVFKGPKQTRPPKPVRAARAGAYCGSCGAPRGTSAFCTSCGTRQ